MSKGIKLCLTLLALSCGVPVTVLSMPYISQRFGPWASLGLLGAHSAAIISVGVYTSYEVGKVAAFKELAKKYGYTILEEDLYKLPPIDLEVAENIFKECRGNDFDVSQTLQLLKEWKFHYLASK